MKFETLSEQYLGQTAAQYDQLRSKGPKWQREQTATEALLARLPAGATLVDVPVGTGRFLAAYKDLGLKATGLDISKDMLADAKAKADALGLDIELRVGDIRNIDAPDGAFDAAVCMRFFNWIDTAAIGPVLKELARVSRRYVICNIRHYKHLDEFRLTPGGARQMAGQVMARLGKQSRAAGLVVHRRQGVDAAFPLAGLKVLERTCIDEGSDGSALHLYFCEKA